MTLHTNNKIRTHTCPDCYICRTKGRPLYQDLEDRLFGVQGKWNLKKCPSPDCGLIWLDPMPLEEDIGKAYVNYYTHQDTNEDRNRLRTRLFCFVKEGYWAKKYGYFNDSVRGWKILLSNLIYLHPLRHAEIDMMVRYLPAQSGRLLDVGCGNGEWLEFMQTLGWLVEGIDFDNYAVDIAKNKGLPVHFGTLETQNYPDNHFDAITMKHVIEHVHQPLRLLLECKRVLKPGGSLVVVSPNSESYGHSLFKSAWFHLDPPRHLCIFGSQSLRRVVEKADFKNIAISTTIRWYDTTFIRSKCIYYKGQCFVNSRQPRTTRLWARGMQFTESAILRLKPDIGEELILIAEK